MVGLYHLPFVVLAMRFFRVLRDERETVRNRAGTPQESRVRTDGVRGREKNNFVGRRRDLLEKRRILRPRRKRLK